MSPFDPWSVPPHTPVHDVAPEPTAEERRSLETYVRAFLEVLAATAHPLAEKMTTICETHVLAPPAAGDPPGPHLTGEDVAELVAWWREHKTQVREHAERLRRHQSSTAPS